jgi:hypothetical protein
MKKHTLSIIIFNLFLLTALTLSSCRSTSNLLSFAQEKGTLLFIKPVESKNSAIPFFTIDFTAIVNSGEIVDSAAVKYSICINNMSRKAIEELNCEFVIGDTVIPLSHTTLYIEKYKKSGIKIRFESKLSPEEARSIIESNEALSIQISNNDAGFSTILPLAKFKEELNELRIYL